jgi:hypothetical protein
VGKGYVSLRGIYVVQLFRRVCLIHTYSHEMPSDPNDPLSNQKLKERYYGTEDPVADKLLRHASEMPQLTGAESKAGAAEEEAGGKGECWWGIT